MKIWTKKAF